MRGIINEDEILSIALLYHFSAQLLKNIFPFSIFPCVKCKKSHGMDYTGNIGIVCRKKICAAEL